MDMHMYTLHVHVHICTHVLTRYPRKREVLTCPSEVIHEHAAAGESRRDLGSKDERLWQRVTHPMPIVDGPELLDHV